MKHATTDINSSFSYEAIKRLLDILFSLILIVIFLPVMCLVAIAIKFDSSGPIFADTPSRVGKNGKHFKMFKFRSMVKNAHELLREDPKFAKMCIRDRY